MITRMQELCRKLKPVLGKRIDGLWAAYLAESDRDGKADIEQTLELLAAKHMGQDYQPDRSPFPPPSAEFARQGDVLLGKVSYGGHELYPFSLRSSRLREHLLVAGRSGSGKTNLTFMLMAAIMDQGIKVLALDWKRGYRDLLALRPGLRVHTIGREVAPFRFNPLIPPEGCEPHVWIKSIVDVIANSYLGGEGVISLLVAGLDHLYEQAGVFDHFPKRWPTVQDLLAWLKTVKLRGRAAMWQASAERILLAMTYGEFASVVDTQSNAHVAELLDHNVILEMDGLSSSSDRTMFSEALTLYVYRYRLAQGPQERLTNLIVIEEAHNLLLAKQPGSKESILENSIRMIRQYGLGYVFVDQSASLLSKVAFANSYATIAMSQKLRADVQAIAGAMNLTDEQREALSTLPVGTAIVRLADEHPEPFMVKIARCPIREGSVSDQDIQRRMSAYSSQSSPMDSQVSSLRAVSALPFTDRKNEIQQKKNPHPPPPEEAPTIPYGSSSGLEEPPPEEELPKMTRESILFLADVAAEPLSTTVARYQRLNLSRRRGNAVRQSLASAGIIEAVALATRSGQVVLCELTDAGRSVCSAVGIDPGPRSRESLEHRFWVDQAAAHFEKKGYEVTREHPIKGNGAVDILAVRPGRRVAVEVETGRSDIRANLAKMEQADFDCVVLLATSPEAVTLCQKEIAGHEHGGPYSVDLMTWLDIS
jgi:energy-coupling factor transporter ATP-binding protein EcfA2